MVANESWADEQLAVYYANRTGEYVGQSTTGQSFTAVI